MDAIDKKILMLLQENAKLNSKEIANKIGLSTTPTYERIKRLEKNGFIKKYIAIVDKKLIGKKLEVFCQVSLQQHSKRFLEVFEREIRKISYVMECYHIAGNYDYLLKLIVSDMEEYQQFIMIHLASIENISNVQSSFVLTEIKNDLKFELE
ncbi:Lrp/AsnC family transcriptional regulator [Aureivirga sp. CE67]|uniref:Lrp/AsnC family transcriptional regulator n=1 Tax=Aureivirga sp. CE67 TaxID=1788983 RepID=UPI0018C96FFB|nr:Lrp/AsnC family transcriptional regulator [Aureivirga sp. CE67]